MFHMDSLWEGFMSDRVCSLTSLQWGRVDLCIHTTASSVGVGKVLQVMAAEPWLISAIFSRGLELKGQHTNLFTPVIPCI